VTIDAAVAADPQRFMAEAIAEARIAGESGDIPIGAIAVRAGKVVASAGNRRQRDHDPTAHAEVLVLREVATQLGTWHLEDVTVVVTLEPCPMCAGALWASRIGGVVFGAADPRAGSTGSLYHLGADPRLNHEYAVLGGICAEECGAVLTGFFGAVRDARRADAAESGGRDRGTAV
jgi:tRNA(adenine34) deaminase